MADDAARMSPDSTINNSEMEDQVTHQSSHSRSDPRAQLKTYSDDTANTPTASKRNHAAMSGDEGDGTPSAAPAPPAKQARKRKDPNAATTGNPAIYSGNKVKHLKKDDGEPLWRKDIQYDFLKAVFDDKQKVFTNSYEPTREKETFADLYIDTMARSSKTSKILKDKLLTEHAPAKNMAMVCLLVNLGRMNTTLNCM
jgi:Ino eighty subunit 1